jgi:hypothetical protein
LKPRKPREAEFWTEVAGVTRGNRQRIIRDHCTDGDRLAILHEPRNRHSKNALGVWIEGRTFLGRRKWLQVGYIPEQDAKEIAPIILDGWDVESFIFRVVGGGPGKYFGLRINVHLHERGSIANLPTAEPAPRSAAHRSLPAAPPGAPPTDAPRPAKARVQLPRIPEPILRVAKAAARVILARVLPYVAISWAIFAIVGRPFDLTGTAFVALAIGAGVLGVRRALKPDSQ